MSATKNFVHPMSVKLAAEEQEHRLSIIDSLIGGTITRAVQIEEAGLLTAGFFVQFPDGREVAVSVEADGDDEDRGPGILIRYAKK
jgi:hypothetical protein